MLKYLMVSAGLAAAALSGCLVNGSMGSDGMHSNTDASMTPSLRILSAYPDDGVFKVSASTENFEYSQTGAVNAGVPTHWHLERDTSLDGTGRSGFIACSYQDELAVDTSLVRGASHLIVSMRNAHHNMVDQGYYGMDSAMGTGCLDMQAMMENNGEHMMEMPSGGHMMDMSSESPMMGDAGGMQAGMMMMPMCTWKTTK